jgi:flagellar hook-associated protein 2
MGNTVDGLVSGMDTTTIIKSMMQIEAAPQTALKTKVSTAQTVVASYLSVNSKLAALQSAGDDLGQLSTWRAITPTSSSTAVTATAVGGTDTVSGAVTFNVKSLARSQASTMRVGTSYTVEPAIPADPLVPTDHGTPAKTIFEPLNVPDTLSISVGGAPAVDIDVSKDKSAKGIAAAVNAAGLGVKASLVKLSETDSMLQFNGTKSGLASVFTILPPPPDEDLKAASFDGSGVLNTTEATEAWIQVGDPSQGGYDIKGNTNTFTGLLPGVTLTATKEQDGITVTTVPDVSGMAAKFQALVDAANATLAEVATQTAYDPSTKTGSPLTGDFTVRQMGQSLLGTVSQGQVGIGSLRKFGVELSKNGQQLTFNAKAFTDAYNADPDSIKAAGIALGDRFEALAKKQVANVTSSITGRNNQIGSMNLQIDNWDVRLAAKQLSLSKTYSDLETALGKLKNQSTWLSGQISSLA